MKHVVVVYQFGKVASTSVVATLNALPEVEAVQAHFLGRDSLKEMVNVIVDPAYSDYFHQHQIGQFVENARTTRLIESYRKGMVKDSALSIISLSRDPFDWFRSSLIQDMEGYRPALESLRPAESGMRLEDRIREALVAAFDRFAAILGEFGGIDPLLAALKADRSSLSAQSELQSNRGLLWMFYMMLRPFSWFDAHYRPAMGHDVAGFHDIGKGVLFRDVGWGRLVVLRYEDLAEQVAHALDRLGIGPVEGLQRENLSDGKELAAPVGEAFRSGAAAALHALFADTAYARRFGYA